MRIIVHEIRKRQRQRESEVFVSNNLIPQDDNAALLYRELTGTFGRNNIYGAFNSDVREDEQHLFPNLFHTWYEDKTDESFIQFTQTATRRLDDVVRPISMAKGGFLVFISYVANNEEFTSLFLIRDVKSGVNFQINNQTHSIGLAPIESIDTSKLAMGCRINHNRYLNPTQKYLSFIRSNQQDDLSGYFLEWLRALESGDSRTYTRNLRNLVGLMDLPQDDEGNQIVRNDFMERVANIVRSQPLVMANLVLLGEMFYDDGDAFINAAQQNRIDLPAEFRATKSELNRFNRVMTKADDISLQFSVADINTKVRVSNDNESVIISSREFANQLLSDFQQYLPNGDM